MLNTHQDGLSESEMLNRIKAARADSEPAQEVVPTEEEEAVSLQDDVEETVEEETQEEESGYEESEQEEVSETESEESEEESLYLIGDEEISLSQIKELKESGLRQSDYTRKTQELAEQRKEVEAKSAKIAELSTTLDSLVADLQSSITGEVESVDWNELADLDPSEFLKKKSAIEEKQAKLKKAQEEQAKLNQVKVNEEAVLLASKMPEWAGTDGEANRQKDTNLALKYAAQLGFSEAELNSVTDHRMYMMLIKAAKYEALQSKAPSIKKKVAKAPKVTPATKSGAKKVSKMSELKAKARRSGKDADVAAAIKQYLGQ